MRSIEKYNVEILETAQNDIIEISLYIGEQLKNPTAAENLVDKIYDMAASLADFPHSHILYYPIDKEKRLKREYRKIPIDNYLLFYHVNEKTKSVIVSRVIYAKRNISAQFK